MLASLLVGVALAAPNAAEPPIPQAAPTVQQTHDELARFVLSAELGSWAVVSRASLNVEARWLSVGRGLLHLHVGGGVGLLSFYLGPAQFDGHVFLGASLGRGVHHAAVRGGPDFVSNTVAGDGMWIYPLVQAGYRYQRPGSSIVVSAWLGTTGLAAEVGWAF